EEIYFLKKAGCSTTSNFSVTRTCCIGRESYPINFSIAFRTYAINLSAVVICSYFIVYLLLRKFLCTWWGDQLPFKIDKLLAIRLTNNRTVVRALIVFPDHELQSGIHFCCND